jgi:hypothetical protein
MFIKRLSSSAFVLTPLVFSEDEFEAGDGATFPSARPPHEMDSNIGDKERKTTASRLK